MRNSNNIIGLKLPRALQGVPPVAVIPCSMEFVVFCRGKCGKEAWRRRPVPSPNPARASLLSPYLSQCSALPRSSGYAQGLPHSPTSLVVSVCLTGTGLLPDLLYRFRSLLMFRNSHWHACLWHDIGNGKQLTGSSDSILNEILSADNLKMRRIHVRVREICCVQPGGLLLDHTIKTIRKQGLCLRLSPVPLES